MGEVVDLNVVTSLPLDPDRVLRAAIGNLSSVVIIGTTTDGDEWFSSSEPDGPSILWDLERAKLKLLRVVETDD
jgi:hypothetical protein